MEEKTRCSRNPVFKYPADEGKGRNSDQGTCDTASFEKPPALDLCTISIGRGGEKKIQRWRTLNGNQPAAYKEPTLLAGVADGKKNSLMVGTVAEGVETRDERWETPRGHGGGGGKCEIAADVPTGIQEFSFSLSLNIFRGRNASARNVPAFQRAGGRAERYGFILAAVPLSENVYHRLDRRCLSLRMLERSKLRIFVSVRIAGYSSVRNFQIELCARIAGCSDVRNFQIELCARIAGC